MAIICIRGGSLSAGHNVITSYVDILSHDGLLQAHTLINLSKLGDSSFEGVWQFDTVLLHKPDILILHFGIDDIYRPVYRSEFKENLVRMVQKARNASINHIILPTLHLVRNQYDMNAVDVFTRTVREVALDMDCLLAMVHIEWINYLYETGQSLDRLLTVDDRYPNEQGHALIAEAIKKKLVHLL
ncbi:MAG: SGNH/GDSL hydrolase family protein [Spirochaetota bacterium]